MKGGIMQYKYTKIEQERRKGERRWNTTRREDEGPCLERHWQLATSPSTMKIFR